MDLTNNREFNFRVILISKGFHHAEANASSKKLQLMDQGTFFLGINIADKFLALVILYSITTLNIKEK